MNHATYAYNRKIIYSIIVNPLGIEIFLEEKRYYSYIRNVTLVPSFEYEIYVLIIKGIIKRYKKFLIRMWRYVNIINI